MNLRKLRALSHVWRWNYHPRIRQESVAEHSYWTAVYALELMKRISQGAAPSWAIGTLYLALYHDAEEAITGDLPAPVKRGHVWDDVKKAALAELDWTPIGFNQMCYDIVKAADLISALVFADEEVKLGNTHFEQIRGELIWAIQNLKLDSACDLVRELGISLSDARAFHSEMSHL